MVVPVEPDAAAAEHATLSALLAARHTEDLPGRHVLDQHGGPEALASLAQHAPRLVTRIRALNLLSLYPDAVHHCVEALDRPEHVTVHVAALRCVSAADRSVNPELAAVLSSWRTHDDPRIQAVVGGVSVTVDPAVDGELPALEAPSGEQ